MSFFEELKRRNVFKVGFAYVVAAWLMLQLTEVLTELLEIGPEVGKIVIVLLIVGFFPAIFFAWAFELTPEGIKRQSEIDRSASITPQTGRKLNTAIIVMLVMVAGYFIWESRFKDRAVGSGSITQVGQAGDTGPGVIEPDPIQTVQTPAPEPVDERRSIVVLPFVNMSADPEQEYFSDGLSEEILNALVKIRDLRVISRTSAFAFKGKDMSLPEIAAKLDVSHVLEGSVRKAGNDVRITAQLIEVESDSHLWSEAYNRSLENVFEIQEEISKAIAGALQVELGSSVKSRRPTDNLEAYQMFLRGRHLYQERGPENLDRAIELLNRVVAMEPGYADAWATLAGASLVRSFRADEGFQKFIDQAYKAARRAIEANPANGFGHAVLGLLHIRAFEWKEAMTALDRAIELNAYEPNSLLWKGISLSILGYHEQALEYLLRAEDVDPIWSLPQSWIIGAYLALGDVDAVARHALKAQDISAESATIELARYELMRGNLSAAEEHWAAHDMQRIGTDVLASALFAALRDESQRDRSIQILLENEDKAGSRTLVPYLWGLGATDEALDHMHRVIDSGRGLRAGIGLATIWAAYHRDQLDAPGLPALFERIGAADYWRKHGDPDLCRVNGDNIKCGEK